MVGFRANEQEPLFLPRQVRRMKSKKEVREHEVAFCADVKSWADALFARHSDWPFSDAKIFFEVPERRERFCTVPGLRERSGERKQVPVLLPDVDCVVGNPPYVRQEHIPKRSQLKRQKDETKHSYEARPAQDHQRAHAGPVQATLAGTQAFRTKRPALLFLAGRRKLAQG